MIEYFILGLCLLVGFILLARWFIATEHKKVVALARWVLAILGLIAGGYLLWSGRALAVLALPLLLPMIMNWRATRSRLRVAQGPSPSQASEVETRFLKMTLDHDSGVMTGLVKEGRFRGRALEDLSMEELVALWVECRAEDAQSAAVLETYLDRTQGDASWREAAGRAGAGPRPPSGEGAMTQEEAYEILGLQPGASPEEIHDAHRRLMQKIHPDHGGSNYLAAKINQAKERLLGA
ncbi:MAG: DnaJ domain-containing protein [Nitrospirota bacterium]|nr:DnaJ domain-containing protein [Nitrospirota bacterium]